MARKYYVTGGEYTDTDFCTLIEGSDRSFGPLDATPAFDLWKGLSMKAIDNCMVRYTIVGEELAKHQKSTG